MPVSDLAAAAATASAIAAAVSAYMSRQAVTRAHRPVVYPEFPPGWGPNETAGTWFEVHLHNGGPGVALDVRWLVRERAGATRTSPASKPLRALRAGVTASPQRTDVQFRYNPDQPGFKVPLDIVIRWTDVAGVRWEYAEPGSEFEPAASPRRVQTYAWQRWRPTRDW